MNEKILDKVRKLLKLGESSNPNEAATAIAHAQRLMEKYEIDQQMLETSSSTEPEEDIREWNDPLDGQTNKSLITWKMRLGSVLCAHNGVYMYLQGGALILVGRASDVQTVRYMYSYCAREIDRLTKFYCKGEGKTYSNNFRLGMIDSISSKLKQERDSLRNQFKQEYSGDSVALVRLNTAIAKIDNKYKEAEAWIYSKKKFGKPKQIQVRHSPTAREHGREVGKQINLSKGAGLGSGSKKQLKG